MLNSFKDLLVWQKSFDLAVAVYHATRSFPADERFGITAELRKTARSIAYNIAEGYKRPTKADYLRFLGIAAGSGGELETQLLLASRLAYLTSDQSGELLDRCYEVERMLGALVRSLNPKP
ncbi:four helix bundle protein [Pendulispora rubella]|uniref:Four helix bundle protein n=1 Tax=Pendulispora rubella TaxID=2741070 RepID=A0ABZ2KUT2_9BACT